MQAVVVVGVGGQRVPVKGTCVVGRGKDADIRIRLPIVSRQHCRVEVSGDKVGSVWLCRGSNGWRPSPLASPAPLPLTPTTHLHLHAHVVSSVVPMW
jgi:hypothetical protein